MRRSFLLVLVPLLGAGLLFPTTPLLAQRASVADVGFSYRDIQKPPGRSPAAFGPGRILLTDGTELAGKIRLRQTTVYYRNGADARELGEGQVREFFIEEHHYVRRPEISSSWLEVIRDTGSRLHLYQQHGRGPNYLARNVATGVVTYIPSRLPTRGYNAYFEDALRPLFADRADLLKLLNGHYITTFNLHKVVDAYNSGQPVQF